MGSPYAADGAASVAARRWAYRCKLPTFVSTPAPVMMPIHSELIQGFPLSTGR
jgi:hypothetical protein